MAKQPKSRNLIDTEDVRPVETTPQATTVTHVHEHEHSDVDIRAIIKYSVILLGSLVVVQLVLWGVFRLLEARAERADAKVLVSPVADSVPFYKGPRVQANPASDMIAFRKQEDSLLNSYGWIDKGTGIARIPVNEAIEILAGRGLPARSGGSSPPDLAPKEQDGGHYRTMIGSSGASQIPVGVASHDSTGAGNMSQPDTSGSHGR